MEVSIGGSLTMVCVGLSTSLSLRFAKKEVRRVGISCFGTASCLGMGLDLGGPKAMGCLNMVRRSK